MTTEPTTTTEPSEVRLVDGQFVALLAALGFVTALSAASFVVALGAHGG